MSRPGKHNTFMEVAETIAKRGTCSRAQVGCVIIRDGRCISWGYNGAPPGADHCDENYHGWAPQTGSQALLLYEDLQPGDEASIGERAAEKYGCRNATHAEANALAFAARAGISTEGAICYVTISPCRVCARLLIAAGIAEVVYLTPYRKDVAEVYDLLHQSMIPMGQLSRDKLS